MGPTVDARGQGSVGGMGSWLLTAALAGALVSLALALVVVVGGSAAVVLAWLSRPEPRRAPQSPRGTGPYERTGAGGFVPVRGAGGLLGAGEEGGPSADLFA